MNKLKQFLTLVKIEINLNKSESSINSVRKKTKLKNIFKVFGILFLMIYFGGLGFTISKGLMEGLVELDAEGYFIKIMMFVVFLVSIITAIGSSTVQLVKEKTNTILNTYPISSKKRFLANFISYLLSSYSMVILLTLVPMIYYGIVKHVNFDYYILLFLTIIFLPLFVSMIIYALIFILNGILKLFLNKRILKWLGFIMMILFSVLYTYIYNNIFVGDDAVEKIVNFVQNIEKSPIFYLSNITSNIILNVDRLQNIVILLGINITLFLIIYLTIGEIYLNEQLRLVSLGSRKGMLFDRKKIEKRIKRTGKYRDMKIEEISTITENTGESIKLGKEDIKKGEEILSKLKFKKRNASFQYFKKEFIFFFKDPNVAANTVLMPLLFPIFMFIGVFSSFSVMIESVKQENNIYFVKELVYETSNKDEQKDLLFSKESINETIEEINGVFKIYNYDLILEKDLNKTRKNKGLPEVYVDESGDIKFKELEKNEKESIEIEVELNSDVSDIQIIDIQEIIKVFNVEVFDKDNNTIYEFLDNNEFNLNKKKIENLKNGFDFNKAAYNSKNVIEFLGKYRSFLKGKIDLGINEYIYFLISVFASVMVSMFTSISIFMISKNKNERSFFKSIPMSDLKQFNLKRLPGIILKVFCLLIYILVIELVMNMFIYTKIYFWLGLLFSVLLIILLETIELYIDSKRPNFNWKTTIQLVKNTFNSFIVVIGKMMLTTAIILIYVFLFHKKNIGLDIFVYALVSLTVLILIFFELLIYKKRNRLLERM